MIQLVSSHSLNQLNANTFQITESSLSIAEVDALITELASKCAFSASAVRHRAPGGVANDATDHIGVRARILRKLYLRLSPAEASLVTQIILKDLRPLLYPLPDEAAHYRTALLKFNNKSIEPLTKWGAMHAWDPSGRMLALYRVRASLEEAAAAYEKLQVGGQVEDTVFQPQIGVPIMVSIGN